MAEIARRWTLAALLEVGVGDTHCADGVAVVLKEPTGAPAHAAINSPADQLWLFWATPFEAGVDEEAHCATLTNK